MSLKSFFLTSIFAGFFSVSGVFAQSSSAPQVICYSASGKNFTVASTCPVGTQRLDLALLTKLVPSTSTTPAFTPKSCSKQRATNQGTNFNGEVGVAASCSKGIMLTRSFKTTDTSRADATLKSEEVLFNKGGIPVGTQVVMKGKQNAFYRLTLEIVCCE